MHRTGIRIKCHLNIWWCMIRLYHNIKHIGIITSFYKIDFLELEILIFFVCISTHWKYCLQAKWQIWSLAFTAIKLKLIIYIYIYLSRTKAAVSNIVFTVICQIGMNFESYCISMLTIQTRFGISKKKFCHFLLYDFQIHNLCCKH